MTTKKEREAITQKTSNEMRVCGFSAARNASVAVVELGKRWLPDVRKYMACITTPNGCR